MLEYFCGLSGLCGSQQDFWKSLVFLQWKLEENKRCPGGTEWNIPTCPHLVYSPCILSAVSEEKWGRAISGSVHFSSGVSLQNHQIFCLPYWWPSLCAHQAFESQSLLSYLNRCHLHKGHHSTSHMPCDYLTGKYFTVWWFISFVGVTLALQSAFGFFWKWENPERLWLSKTNQ